MLKLEPSKVMKEESQSSNCIFNGQLQNRASSAAVIGCPQSITFKVVLHSEEVEGPNFQVTNGKVIKVELNNVTDAVVPIQYKFLDAIDNRQSIDGAKTNYSGHYL